MVSSSVPAHAIGPPGFTKIVIEDHGQYLIPSDFAVAMVRMIEATESLALDAYGLSVPVRLVDCGKKFISTIKEVRSLVGMNLKDAKAFCDKVRAGEKKNLGYYSWSKAQEIQRIFANAGARVEVDDALSLLARQAE